MLLPVQVESGRTRPPRTTLSLLLITTFIYLLTVAQGFYEHGVSLAGVRTIPDSVLAFWALLLGYLGIKLGMIWSNALFAIISN